MARTPSNMISLGSKAPNFNLLDVTSNSTLSLFESKGSIGTVIMFICNHCPYVKHVNPTISKLAKDYNSDEIKFIAISSNDVVNYPDDSPEKMKINAIDNDFNFPYLYGGPHFVLSSLPKVFAKYQDVCGCLDIFRRLSSWILSWGGRPTW